MDLFIYLFIEDQLSANTMLDLRKFNSINLHTTPLN